MRKYKWSLLKALEFLNSRRPDLEIREAFIHQLSAYEARLANVYKSQVSSRWDELSNKQPTYACEELVLRNTFLNSQMGPLPQNQNEPLQERKRALKWIDNDQEKTQGPLLVISKSEDDLNLKEKVEPVQAHKKPAELKAAIKPFTLNINQLTGIQNFTQLSRDPLKLPDYALELTGTECADPQESQLEAQTN